MIKVDDWLILLGSRYREKAEERGSYSQAEVRKETQDS